MPIISHTGAHTSVATTARQERISLGLTTVRRKITVSAGQIGSRFSRGTISGSRASQVLTPTSSQCPSPRISTVTAPGITPFNSQPAVTTIQEINTLLDYPDKKTHQSSFKLLQRKLSTVVSPQLCDTDGCDSRKTSGPVASPDLLTPPDSSSLRLTYSRSLFTAHIPIAIHIEGPNESSNNFNLAFPAQLEKQLLGVDTVSIPVKKHSTSARVTNLRAQAEQLRRMRTLTEKRPEWFVRLIEGTRIILVLFINKLGIN